MYSIIYIYINFVLHIIYNKTTLTFVLANSIFTSSNSPCFVTASVVVCFTTDKRENISSHNEVAIVVRSMRRTSEKEIDSPKLKVKIVITILGKKLRKCSKKEQQKKRRREGRRFRIVGRQWLFQ